MLDITRPSFLVLLIIVVFSSSLALEHATAVPTTGAATLVGSNNVTVAMSGAATTCWFEWGILPGSGMTWDTPNRTPSGGMCNTTIKGSPLVGNQVFYFRACDATGCGDDGTFTTAAVTPIPAFTYGAIFDNMTENNFDITMIGEANMGPYSWLVPTLPSLIWGLIWGFMLIGLWWRGRDMGYTVGIGVLVGIILFSPAYGLGIGIPQEFATIGQGILYASLAGVILVIIKK